MKSIFAAFAVAMTALATSATLSAAQQYDDVPPPQDQQQPGGVPQSGVGSENCLRLESQLASLGRSKVPDPTAIRQQLARQQAELERSQAQYKQMSCGPRFIFAPAPPAECGPLGDRIKQMQANLERAQSQASQPPQQDPRRRELLIALARGQCGPQYRLVERRVTSQQPEQRKGFFEMLFGGGGNDSPREETVIEPEMDGGEAPRVSTYRTVCVRTCDGFFFPISFQTSRNAFERDQAICQATCPGAEAKLYAYPNPGGQMEQAADIDGQPYTKLENAFRYRKEFVAGCSCKPEGMSWAEALQGVDDKTVKKGDIVVDEQKAHELSQPGSQAQATSPRNQQRPRLPNQPQPSQQQPAQPSGAPQDLAPPPDAPQPATGSTRGQPSDDVIILNQPPLDRSRIQGRPLDGPNMQRQP